MTHARTRMVRRSCPTTVAPMRHFGFFDWFTGGSKEGEAGGDTKQTLTQEVKQELKKEMET